MKNALRSIEDYEKFVYLIKDRYSEISVSKLVVIHRGPHQCILQGSVHFEDEIVLHVYERLDFLDQRIAYYSYEVYQSEQIIYWYDPQPHPNDPTLASSHPHHKHIQPDIKHHRIPARELSFEQPNLRFLIEEIITDILKSK